MKRTSSGSRSSNCSTNPAFTVHAWNPAAAKGIEEDIRENLVSLKNIIQNSAQIQAKQTFEL